MNLPLFLARIRQFAPLLLVLVSATAAVAAYLQALGYPFILDDVIYITDNPNLTGLHLTELWRLFTEPYNGNHEFLPLRDISFWFDITLFGLNPAAFRLHNILLYLLCLPLAYATTLELWRYFRSADAASAPWAAAAVTALFALHPTMVESVVWASGRKYMLPNLFSMLALWLTMRARREQGLSAPYAAAALIAFAAVMLSKSSYVGVALLIALLWVVFWLDIPKSDRRRSQLLWPLAILFLLGLFFLIFIVASGGTGTAGFTRATGVTAYFGIETITRILAVLGWLARLAVSPESRNFYFPVFEDSSLPVMVAIGVAVLAAAATGGVIFLRKRSLERFSLIAFLLLCAPYMQLISYQTPTLVSDRYVALAVWPAILLLVALLWRLKPALRAALLLAIALPWGFQTMERPRDWRSFEALVDTDLRAYPGYYMPALFKIGYIQLPQGLYREAREVANSITVPEFRNIMIRLVEAHYAVRVNAVATGRPQEAMALLWKLGLDLKQQPVQGKWNTPVENFWVRCIGIVAVQWVYLAAHFPGDASVRYNAGLSLLDFYKYEDAAIHLRAATESQHLPVSVRGTAYKNLGLSLLRSQHVAEAEAPLLAALKQSPPDLRAHCLLSEVYKQTHRIEEAARAAADCPDSASHEETVR